MTITPVLLVEAIEPSLPFWIERLGWQQTAEVPGDEGLAFVMLVREGATLMLQTFSSARKDEPRFITDATGHRSSLFVLVDDWADTLKRLEGYEVTMPERETFYGMREIGVFDPGGHVVVFAKAIERIAEE